MIDCPLVTVVVLCRNECDYIGACLESLLANDYPKDRLEILVVDGMSDDGTRDIVRDFNRRYPLIKLVDNPKKITPAAMNTGVQNAKGEAIAIVGAHSTYNKRYLSEYIRHLKEYNADEVGAVAEYIPRQNTLVGWAIAAALAHPFGAGANVRYKVGAKEPVWVDTVSSGCYHRDVFNRIGLFNEKLVFSQDIEFNLRLRQAGGRILLVPTAVIRYYSRSGFNSFCRHNFRNGLWSILPFLYSPIIPVSWRHLVPLAFVLALLGSAGLATVWSPALWVFIGTTAAYAMASVIASIQVAFAKRGLRYLLVMPAIFASLHLGYGLGSLLGVVKTLFHVASSRSSKLIREDPVH